MPDAIVAGAQGLYYKIIETLINPALMLLFTAGFFWFVYGIVKFMYEMQSGGHGDEGKKHMIWGIVGMFIMSAVWGILGLMNSTFGWGIDFKNPLNSNINANQVPGFTGSFR